MLIGWTRRFKTKAVRFEQEGSELSGQRYFAIPGPNLRTKSEFRCVVPIQLGPIFSYERCRCWSIAIAAAFKCSAIARSAKSESPLSSASIIFLCSNCDASRIADDLKGVLW